MNLPFLALSALAVAICFATGCSTVEKPASPPPHEELQTIGLIELGHALLQRPAQTNGIVIQVLVSDLRTFKEKRSIGEARQVGGPFARLPLFAADPPALAVRDCLLDSLGAAGYSPRKRLRLQPINAPLLSAEIVELWGWQSMVKGIYKIQIDLALFADGSDGAKIAWKRTLTVECKTGFARIGWEALQKSHQESFSKILTAISTDAAAAFQSGDFQRVCQSGAGERLR